jgi:hypothetical protein
MQRTPQEYILNTLANIRTGNSPRRSSGESEKLVDCIYRRVTSKKFRKYGISPEYQAHIRSAIALNIQRGEPIKVVFPYGGYKLWRLDEAPEVDWAELFSLTYFASWLAPIPHFYKPGVWFDFSSSDINVEYANNVDRADLDAYSESMTDLFAFLKPFLPENINFTLTRVRSRYQDDEFKEEIDRKAKEIMQKNKGMLPVLSEKQKEAIEMNVKLGEDQAADPLWREKNNLMYEAYHALSRVRSYYRTPDKIVASAASRNSSIPTGTTRASIVKFQVGVGALQRKGDGFIEVILSPKQMAAARWQWECVDMSGLKGKNFKKIRVINVYP